MTVIDQRVTWAKVEERLETETDPELRRNLELLLQHQIAEASLDMEKLMATVSEHAHYHMHSIANGAGDLVGKSAVQKFYEDFAASGAQKLQLDTEWLVVDRHCIVTEGTMRMAYPGSTLAARGVPVDDVDASYLYEARMCVLWPIGEDGLFTGEDTYTSTDGFIGIEHRKLSPSDIATI
ncbi:unannotated protein [freshwater metagenome]|jgi:hypothetical protein|uniref:Unannotated protein n=1 Tax=freshwater metagenome TaxID=449393 RepID=A0A6J6IIG5_9ZZZZ|nr:nuclear transport factor 2 family protein [Actinomycetota bacterium]MSZ23793.1 nuclear transport factor 2 family protein [Actinomycetota bacterium]MSZ93000.1 nuclear transport factor 2 family protein [Actinomycetota bacterium]